MMSGSLRSPDMKNKTMNLDGMEEESIKYFEM